MPEILHRLTIDAPLDEVHDMVATKGGLERWWTGRDVGGDENAGGELRFYFGDSDDPAAVMNVIENTPESVVWSCVGGPADWQGTKVIFALKPASDGATTLMFTHGDWREPTEFMHMCSTHWASYLIGLKNGLEGRSYKPWPQGEVNLWP